MSKLKDVSVQVKNEHGDRVSIVVGPNIYDIRKSDLAAKMAGDQDPIDMLIVNIAARLTGAGVDLDDGARLKTELEKVNFKIITNEA